MQQVCPITDKRIDERVARINGLIVFTLVLSFVLLNFWEALMLLAIDFILRGFIDGKYSPLATLSKYIVSKMTTKPKILNAGPKIFAAQVGVVLSTIALILLIKGFNVASIAIVSVLGVFSFLEGAFGYCVACKLYPLFRKIA